MQCLWKKMLSILKVSFSPILISRFTEFSIKYQYSFRGSNQSDSQMYTEEQKPETVNNPKKEITYLGEGAMSN